MFTLHTPELWAGGIQVATLPLGVSAVNDAVKGIFLRHSRVVIMIPAVIRRSVTPMTLANPTVGSKEEEEWQELQALLRSGILDKAPNLRHFLEYVAEQHFAGKTEQIKEYSIAIHALHRQEQFDPQSDTIVRVSAHTLRKKLEHYYSTDGADHLIQIRLPAGKYVLQFWRKELVYSPPLEPVDRATEPTGPTISANRSDRRGSM